MYSIAYGLARFSEIAALWRARGRSHGFTAGLGVIALIALAACTFRRGVRRASIRWLALRYE